MTVYHLPKSYYYVTLFKTPIKKAEIQYYP